MLIVLLCVTLVSLGNPCCGFISDSGTGTVRGLCLDAGVLHTNTWGSCVRRSVLYLAPLPHRRPVDFSCDFFLPVFGIFWVIPCFLVSNGFTLLPRSASAFPVEMMMFDSRCELWTSLQLIKVHFEHRMRFQSSLNSRLNDQPLWVRPAALLVACSTCHPILFLNWCCVICFHASFSILCSWPAPFLLGLYILYMC